MRISTALCLLGVGLAIGAGAVLMQSIIGGDDGQPDAVARNLTELTVPVETVADGLSRETKRRRTRQRIVENPASPFSAVMEVQTSRPGLFDAEPPSGDVGKLTQIVAVASGTGEQQNDQLTEEQKQIVAFFERTARELNEAGGQQLNQSLEFDHLAIDGLDVRYYYTVRRNYADLNPAVILSEQRTYIGQTICNDPAVRQLIGDYGFRYSYSYISAEKRLIGRLDASLAQCG